MQNSKIEWCDHTFNPWIGCTKVSPGCAHCYAEARDKRHLIEKVDHWGQGAPRLRTSAANWRKPLAWNRAAPNDLAWEDHRPRVFCASLADWLDDEVPIAWLADLLKLIHDTPNLDWLLLTKRPENWCARINQLLSLGSKPKSKACGTLVDDPFELWLLRWALKAEAPSHVWLGTTVENQEWADKRIPALLRIPARIRFLSAEPLLGPIDFKTAKPSDQGHEGVDWIIFGGESGPGARACNVDWIRDGLLQCQAAGVPAFVKQLGGNAQCGNANLYDWPDAARLVESHCIEGAAACRIRLRDKKGGDWQEWPEQLRIRQFPSVP